MSTKETEAPREESKAKLSLPDQLPQNPTGWTKSLVLHMNFGREGGAASYEVKDEKGELTPIGYHYDTRKSSAKRGFSLPNIEGLMTWQQLVAAWPKWVAEHRKTEGRQ